jgi:hypothetical protein
VNVDSVALLPVADRIEVPIGPKAAGHLIDGFSKLEGRTVWSLGPRSKVGAVLAPKAVGYQLRVRGHALPAIAPLGVTAKVNGTALGAAAYTPKVGETTWDVPAQVLRAGVNEVEFSYPKTEQPAAYNPKSTDTRELAIRFYEIALTPVR